MVGACAFPGNPYDGDTLAEQVELAPLFTDMPVQTALLDLGYRGREAEAIRILHRGKPKRMSKAEKRLLKRCQAVELGIGHLEADHCMRQNFIKGALGDAMNPILAAAGFNISWLMRWIVIFWRWILSSALRLVDYSRSDARSGLVSAAA